MSDKLKPCPFCGSKNLEFYVGGRYGFVGCNQCDCDSAMTDDAIAAWNRRTDPVKAQLIEALKAIRLQLLQSNNDSDYAQEAIEKARAALAAAEAD